MSQSVDQTANQTDFQGLYEELLRKYKELQLRVTRFSAVEQQMINIRFRLDHEIAMHKRMHDSNKKALLEMTDDEFAKFIAESVVDIFEVQVGVAIIRYTDQESFVMAGSEGITIHQQDVAQIESELASLCALNKSGNILEMNFSCYDVARSILPMTQAYGSHLTDPANNISLVITGGILEGGLALYDQVDKERDVIFSVFAQQVLAQVVNRKKNKTIRQQVEKIETAGRRLERITESFLSFGASPRENIDLLTRLCGDLLGADISNYFRLDEPVAHCTTHDRDQIKIFQGAPCNLCFSLQKTVLDDTFIFWRAEEYEALKTQYSCHKSEMKTFFGCAVMLENRHMGSLSVIFGRDFIPDENDKQVLRIISAGIAVEELRNISIENLRKNEQLLASVVQTQQEMICRFLPDTTLTFVNKPFCNLFRRSEQELIGKKILRLIPKSYRPEVIGNQSQISPEHPSNSFIHQTKQPDGTVSWQEWTETAILDKQGRIIEFQAIGRDITESRQAREKAEESDRLKTAFLVNISHEIRTPMNGIFGFLKLIEKHDLDEKQKKEFQELVITNGKRLLTTFDDIIEISKVETGVLKVSMNLVHVEPIMEQQYDLFASQAREKGISLRIAEQVSDADSIVMTDRVKLGRILTYLITNALKFTSKGSIEFGNFKENNSLVFYVRDSGRGIPPDKINAIFDRFVQADMGLSRLYEGSGIGLSIAKAYVEALKGKIWVTSELNKGSTFFFSIPLMPKVL